MPSSLTALFVCKIKFIKNKKLTRLFTRMYDIEDIGDSGDVRDDSTFKKGKVVSRKHQRKALKNIGKLFVVI